MSSHLIRILLLYCTKEVLKFIILMKKKATFFRHILSVMTHSGGKNIFLNSLIHYIYIAAAIHYLDSRVSFAGMLFFCVISGFSVLKSNSLRLSPALLTEFLG